MWTSGSVRRTARLVIGLAAALVALPRPGAVTLAAARAPMAAQDVAALRVRAQALGRVRVIVGQRATTGQVVSSVQTGTIADIKTFETLPFFAATVDTSALDELSRSPMVASIEEDVRLRPTLMQSVPLVDAPQAWSAGFSGGGWAVAILDSGVDGMHPFLSGKVISDACYSTTDTSGMTSSRSLCPNGASVSTDPGSGAPCSASIGDCAHGTHVAGIAAGRGAAFSGVAPDADLVSVKVVSGFSGSDCGGPSACIFAWTSDVIAGLDRVYALRDQVPIAAVNISLGGNSTFTSTCDSASPAMAAAVGQLKAAGIATVVAAGNAASTSGLSFPACLSSAVSVGSTTKGDTISSFSDTSGGLALLAPGDSIYSSMPGGGFAYMSGTSMAAPHVTGAWAILKHRKPTAAVDEILGALRATGLSIEDARPGSGGWFPRIRIYEALAALVTPQPMMAIDVPSAGTLPRTFALAGWAIDRGAASGSGVDAVHIWAYPSDGSAPTFLGVAAIAQPRGDLGALFGAHFASGGYTVQIAGLAPGSYRLAVYAHSSVSGTFNQSRTVDVTIPASWPAMSVDGPANGTTIRGPFGVGGWAIDRASATDAGVDAVHVWAMPVSGGSPVFLGTAATGVSRPDVGAVFGSQFDRSGFSLGVSSLTPGTYDLTLYARSSVTGAFNQTRTVRVTITP